MREVALARDHASRQAAFSTMALAQLPIQATPPGTGVIKRTLTTDDLPALMTGIMATLAAIGIARFAYTPLLPAIIQQGWFTASQGAYLGAANLLGYFIGATR